MAYPWHYDEEGDEVLQSFMFPEEYLYLPDFRSNAIFCMYLLRQWSFEYYPPEGAPLYATQHLSTNTTQSYLLQGELDALLHGDIQIPCPALEEGAHHKGAKEPKQELGGDAAVKKREGSEDALSSSPTQYLCTSTTSAQSQSCLSQDSFLAAFEGDHYKGEKDLKQDLDRDTGKKKRVRRLRNGPEEKPLVTFKLVSQYFCMPVKQAAEELNVGLTHLKRKCRELGIPRWPHRKVKSLETLIKNAQELGKSNIEVERLQQKKKLIEENPGHVELDEETKVLRQACFKEKFKRRRLMAIQDDGNASGFNLNLLVHGNFVAG